MDAYTILVVPPHTNARIHTNTAIRYNTVTGRPVSTCSFFRQPSLLTFKRCNTTSFQSDPSPPPLLPLLFCLQFSLPVFSSSLLPPSLHRSRLFFLYVYRPFSSSNASARPSPPPLLRKSDLKDLLLSFLSREICFVSATTGAASGPERLPPSFCLFWP